MFTKVLQATKQDFSEQGELLAEREKGDLPPSGVVVGNKGDAGSLVQWLQGELAQPSIIKNSRLSQAMHQAKLRLQIIGKTTGSPLSVSLTSQSQDPQPSGSHPGYLPLGLASWFPAHCHHIA
jgi:hypothetical protein